MVSAGACARTRSEKGGIVGVGRWSGQLPSFLLLDRAGSFDKRADEVFRVAVDGGNDGGRDGLGQGLVRDLEQDIRNVLITTRLEGWQTFRTVSFFNLVRRN